MQFLFGLEFTGYAWEDEIEDFWTANPAKPGARKYAEKLIRGVFYEEAVLAQRLEASLEGWNMGRVGYVERVLLRMALYEMLFEDDVPAGVAINEAIELAKQYGSDETPRFINGVLDGIRRKMESEEAC